MSCTNITNSLMDLLTIVAAHPRVLIDQFDPEQFDMAISYGWVYEYRGRAALTGAGAWHAGVERRGGVLPG